MYCLIIKHVHWTHYAIMQDTKTDSRLHIKSFVVTIKPYESSSEHCILLDKLWTQFSTLSGIQCILHKSIKIKKKNLLHSLLEHFENKQLQNTGYVHKISSFLTILCNMSFFLASIFKQLILQH